MINYFSLVDIARVTSIYKKGGRMKKSIETSEMYEAWSDIWRENLKIEASESQSLQLARENNMPSLSQDEKNKASLLFKK